MLFSALELCSITYSQIKGLLSLRYGKGLSISPCFMATLVLATFWNHLTGSVLYIACLPHYNVSSIQVQSLLSVSLYPLPLE